MLHLQSLWLKDTGKIVNKRVKKRGVGSCLQAFVLCHSTPAFQPSLNLLSSTGSLEPLSRWMIISNPASPDWG